MRAHQTRECVPYLKVIFSSLLLFCASLALSEGLAVHLSHPKPHHMRLGVGGDIWSPVHPYFFFAPRETMGNCFSLQDSLLLNISFCLVNQFWTECQLQQIKTKRFTELSSFRAAIRHLVHNCVYVPRGVNVLVDGLLTILSIHICKLTTVITSHQTLVNRYVCVQTEDTGKGTKMLKCSHANSPRTLFKTL